MPLIAWKQSFMRRSVTDRARIVYGSVFVTVRCPSVCLTHLSTAACRCSGFAAVGPAVSTAFSSDCEQCHVVSWRRMLSTDLFTEWIVKRYSFTDCSAFQMHLHGNSWELQEPKCPEVRIPSRDQTCEDFRKFLRQFSCGDRQRLLWSCAQVVVRTVSPIKLLNLDLRSLQTFLWLCFCRKATICFAVFLITLYFCCVYYKP